MEKQANAIIYHTYDYFMRKSQNLSVVISIEPIRESLRDSLLEAFLQSPPPELATLPSAIVGQAFNEFYQEFSERVPSTFKFNESSLPPKIMSSLELVKQGLGYFRVGYPALIGFTALVILLITLLNRWVRNATHSIDITSLVVGVFGLVEVLLANRFAEQQIAQLDIPTQLQTWIPQLISDILAPL